MIFNKKNKDHKKIEDAKSTFNMDGQIQVAVDQLKSVVEQMNLTSLSLDEISSSSKIKTSQLFSHSEQTVNFSRVASEKMKEIEASALHISAFSQEILSNSQTSNEELHHSFHSFQLLQKKFENLSQSHNLLLDQMYQLVEYSNQIHDIVYAIGAISKQTKILALNASIEAARAGEHGKGFSVVAKEVGNLANQTSQAVEETRETINKIQSEIKSTTEKVKQETSQVHEGSNEMNNIMHSLETFKEKLNSITKMVEESTEAADIQRDNVQDISKLLEDIAEMALENKEYVDQVAEDFNKQHENVEEIRSINLLLTNTSSELQALVNQHAKKIKFDESSLRDIKALLSNKVNDENLLLDEQNHKHVIDGILFVNNQLEAIWTNRKDGTFIYSNPPAGLANAKMRPWFKEAIAGNEYISEPYISSLTKKYCVTLSYPIFNHDKEVIGVFGADVALDNSI